MTVLNEGQIRILNAAVDWYKNRKFQVFQYSGAPGTGKTTLLKEIIKALDIDVNRIAPMSYVGAAVMNMRMNGLLNARTIHSWMFNVVEDVKLGSDGRIMMDTYFNTPLTTISFTPKPLNNIDLIVIDEASSCPARLRGAIEAHGIPIIATGDIDQLPPVADDPAYLYNESEVYRLTEIMRQSKGSSIIDISQKAIRGLPINRGYYGDALVIYEDELTDDMLLNSNIIICGKNSTRDYYNKYMRKILGKDTLLPEHGEPMICRQNNWSKEVEGISLANGLMGIVNNYPDITTFDNRKGTYMIDFKPFATIQSFGLMIADYRYLMGNANKDTQTNPRYQTGNKFDFCYAITAHLSQGSQFRNVIYIEEFLNKDINAKLNYVGASRATENHIYVKRRYKSSNEPLSDRFC